MSRKKKKTIKKPASAKQASPLKKESLAIPGLILFLIAVMLYGMTLNYDYVLDDKIVHTENSFVQEGFAGIAKILTTESMTGYLGTQKDLLAGGRYRPLSIVSFAIEHQLWGYKQNLSHLINILWYALSAVLLLLLGYRLFPEAERKEWYFAIPFVAALLYVLHPLHSEAVANVKGRDELMAFSFCMASLLLVLKYVDEHKIRDLLLATALYFLGLLSKETALPFLVVYPLSLIVFRSAEKNTIGKISGIMFFMACLYMGLRWSAVGFLFDSGNEVTGLLNNPFLEANTGEKFATIFYTLGLYLKLLVFPWPLTHDYYPYHIPIISWGDFRALIPLILYFGIGIYAALNIRKNNVPAYAILFFIATLSVSSNIVLPVGTFMNERFLYMPSWAFCLLFAWFFFRKEAVAYKKVGMVLTAVFAILFAGITINRLPDWKNSESLNRSAVEASPNSCRANSFMGYELYMKGNGLEDKQQKMEHYKSAYSYASRSLAIFSEYPDALTVKAGSLAGIYQLDGNLSPLLQGFLEVLEAKPIGFVNEYMQYLNKREDKQQLAEFYYKAGYETLFLKARDYPHANHYLNMGQKLNPNHFGILYGRVAVLYQLGKYKRAVEVGQLALQLNPEFPELCYYLGLSLKETGDVENSTLLLEKAYSLKPELKQL